MHKIVEGDLSEETDPLTVGTVGIDQRQSLGLGPHPGLGEVAYREETAR